MTHALKLANLEASLALADEALSNVARRRVLANAQFSINVTVYQWDLENEETQALKTGHSQNVVFDLNERGTKSFIIGPQPKKKALIQQPGSSFQVEMTFLFMTPRSNIGGGDFSAMPGTHWEQDEFLVRDTFNLDARGVWLVKLHFADAKETSTNGVGTRRNGTCNRLLERVSVTHDPDDHKEIIDRMMRAAFEDERHLLMPLMTAQTKSTAVGENNKKHNCAACVACKQDDDAAVEQSDDEHEYEDGDEEAEVVGWAEGVVVSAEKARQMAQRSARISPPTPKRQCRGK